MKKMFAGMLLAAIAAVACQSKKAPTTPAQDPAPMESQEDATGGAAYGGKGDASGKDTPSPPPN